MSALEYLSVPWTPIKYVGDWHAPEDEGPFLGRRLCWRFQEQNGVGLDLTGDAIGGKPGSVIGYIPLDIVRLLPPERIGKRIYSHFADVQLDADGALRGWPR